MFQDLFSMVNCHFSDNHEFSWIFYILKICLVDQDQSLFHALGPYSLCKAHFYFENISE